LSLSIFLIIAQLHLRELRALVIATRKTAVSYRRGSGSARGVENSSGCLQGAGGLFRAPLTGPLYGGLSLNAKPA